MTWIDDHRQSEQFASDATLAYRRGDELAARALYVKAAEAEQNALLQLDTTKARTRGVTAVSVVSLWFKAGDYTKAEQLAYSHLSAADIPAFARSELRSLVQAIWTEDAKHQAGMAETEAAKEAYGRGFDDGFILRKEKDGNGQSEYICTCGIRVTPHRCPTDNDF